MGIEAVATYAVALSVLQLVRTFSSIVYSPYSSRYNHFVGLGDYAGLTHFVRKMIIMFAPIIIVPILTLSLSAEPFVISWVGDQYKGSGMLVSFLVMSFIFNFIKEPIGAYFVATERNNILVLYNILIPVVFWIGVALLVSALDTKAFAIMKAVAPLVSVVAYWILAYNDFNNMGFAFISFWHLIKTILPSIILVFVFSWFMGQWMQVQHSRQALLVNVILLAIITLSSLVLSIPFNSELRLEVSHYVKTIREKYLNK